MVKPELARDESGNVIGVTADNIGQVPMARKLGLGDGDILQTVNNEQIDSEQKIYEVIQKFQNANSIRIGVMSGGKPKVITYRLN
jgi:type II secretory pathway component PulC